MNPPLRNQVRSSVRLTLGGTFAAATIQAATMVVLARLLGPVDYGLFIVALSINALSTQFVASATERAMVIEPDVHTLAGRAIPTLVMLAGVGGIAFAVVAIAKAILGWKVHLGVLAVIMSGQVLSGLAVVPRALLRREIRFGPIVASELTGLLLGNLLTGATLAWLGFGALALAIANFVQSIIATSWMLMAARSGVLRPRFRALGTLPATLLGVMKPTVLEALNGQISPVVVSSVLGPVTLGLFNRVYNITTLPIQLLVNSVNRVIISALLNVVGDPPRLRSSTELMLRGASAMITPIAFGLAGSGSSFIAIVLGPKWLAAVPIVPFLAIAVWGNMLGSLFGQLVDAVRRFNDKARIQAISTIALIMSLIGGSHWGLVGVSVGAMTAALLFLALYIRLAADIVGCSTATVVRWLLPGAAAGLSCFGAARAMGWVLSERSLAIVLGSQMLICGIIAPVILMTTDRQTILSFSRLLLPVRIYAFSGRLAARFQRG